MTSQAFIWAEAVAKSCENSVLICRMSSACTQQKRITDRLGILCFEHHKVVFDISFAIPKAHPQHDVVCTALLSPTSSSCSILLHFNSTIPVLMLLLFLAGCSPQFPQSKWSASGSQVHQTCFVQSSHLLWQQPLVSPAVVLYGAP